MSDTKLEEDTKKRKPPRAGMGRPKGAVNKSTAAIKEMLLASLDAVGGQAYFEQQALENPTAYMSLVGKIIPAEVKKEIQKRIREHSDQIVKTLLPESRWASVDQENQLWLTCCWAQ